jgi:hypothetical protein
MLQTFWLDLLQNNPECVVYFHNWAGYDAILSLTPLLSLHTFGYNFKPILQDGERHSTYSSSQEKYPLTYTGPVRNEIVTPAQAINILNNQKVINVITLGDLQLISYSVDFPISAKRFNQTK